MRLREIIIENTGNNSTDSVEEFKKYASDLGNNLYTLTAFDEDSKYNGPQTPLFVSLPMIEKLEELGEPFRHAALFFERHAGMPGGSIVQMFLNGRTNKLAFLVASPEGFKFESSDNLDSSSPIMASLAT